MDLRSRADRSGRGWSRCAKADFSWGTNTAAGKEGLPRNTKEKTPPNSADPWFNERPRFAWRREGVVKRLCRWCETIPVLDWADVQNYLWCLWSAELVEMLFPAGGIFAHWKVICFPMAATGRVVPWIQGWLFWGHVSTESRGNSGIHQFSSMYCSRPQKPMAILTRSYLCLAEQGRPTTPTGIWDWNQFLTPSPNPLQNVPVQVSGVYWHVLQSGCQWPESLALEKFISVCT